VGKLLEARGHGDSLESKVSSGTRLLCRGWTTTENTIFRNKGNKKVRRLRQGGFMLKGNNRKGVV